MVLCAFWMTPVEQLEDKIVKMTMMMMMQMNLKCNSK